MLRAGVFELLKLSDNLLFNCSISVKIDLVFRGRGFAYGSSDNLIQNDPL